MRRTFPVYALLLAFPLAANAAAPPKLPAIVVRMTVQPKAAPKPALKYQLLPELREMNPGNPIQGYLKCFMEQTWFFHNKKANEDREKWRTMPLKDLPLKEMQYYCTNGGLRQADYAARLDTPDWQILLKLKSDGINLLVPAAQKMRSLASALEIRFRIELAERRFTDAIATTKTMLALSRHFNDHPTLIGDLIGVAIGTIALSRVDEMIGQEGCPNLFWALTDLPKPFIDLRKGMQGTRTDLVAEFSRLDEREPMTDAQLQRVVNRLQRLMVKNKDIHRWLDGLAKNEDHLRAARQRLIASGLVEVDVKKFAARQVLLLDEKREYETRRDEWMKAISLPYWQAQPFFAALPQPNDDDPTMLFALFLYHLDKIKGAQARLDQRIALLRCVEALRMYAAENEGKLPAKLDDIRLPLPVDPATGKPFSYKVDGKTAHLHGEPLGVEVRYEVTIGK